MYGIVNVTMSEKLYCYFCEEKEEIIEFKTIDFVGVCCQYCYFKYVEEEGVNAL